MPGGPPSAGTDAHLLLTALLQSWGLLTHWLCPSWISRGSDEAWGQTGRYHSEPVIDPEGDAGHAFPGVTSRWRRRAQGQKEAPGTPLIHHKAGFQPYTQATLRLQG